MVATAETASRFPSQFDWDLAELQFADTPSYTRAPEREVYGRSLSTIRRLGALMMRQSPAEVIQSPEAAQAKVEFYTSVEEGFGTDMELGGGLEVRDFDERPILNGRVMSKDLKTSISDMTNSGLKCAIETAAKDQRFMPQLVRSEWDHQNALTVDRMARGETGYNTRIVISPFPEEGAKQSGNDYWRNIGYVPHLKRGFVQLYHATENGLVVTGSLSFDGTNKQRLRDVFRQFGVDIPETEVTDNWLNYAITRNLSAEDAKILATSIADAAADPQYKKSTNTVTVTKKYKPLMERVFNESYIHICASLYSGRQTDGARKLISQLANNAKSFNKRYAKALYQMRANTEQFTDADSVVLHELLVYSTIEMMRALHTGKSKHVGGSTYLQSADAAAFQSMLSSFGAEGARHNRTYSACGLSISLGEEDEHDPENPQAAFGGADRLKNGTDRYGSRKFLCPKGHWNERPVDKLISHCKVCGTSVSCGNEKNLVDTSRAGSAPTKAAGEKQYVGIFSSKHKEKAKAKAENKMRVTKKETGKLALAGVG